VLSKELPEHIVTPPKLIENHNFLVKLAETEEEIRMAQKLRYRVFNQEQGKGLKEADENGIDSDEFDEFCLHLIVIDKKTQDVIGTYRAHIGYVARGAKGFYSSREYRIEGLDKISDRCIELGRSCVAPEYRTGTVVVLLWSAISVLLMRTDLVYMIGCVSLEVTDPKIGWALYEYIKTRYPASRDIIAVPKPEFKLKKPPKSEIDEMLKDTLALKNHIPALFKGYLRLGALICGEPALDKDFGTIDFFVLVDTRKIPERYTKYFNYIRPKT